MSLIPNGLAKSAAAGGFYDHPIEQSLRLNDDDSAYLSWTPASAGNQQTFTWSGWVKRGNLGTYQALLEVYVSATDFFLLQFDNADRITYYYINAGTDWGKITTAKYRDTSAWYHVTFVNDSTNATAADRMRLYVNGERVTQFDADYGDMPQNTYSYVNSANLHKIGYRQDTGTYLDGYLAEVHFIDGTALDASSFGETKSGVWIPKAYSGSYGTNGFYLPFNHDYSVEGFSATTYTGNGGTQYIGGVGFSPDLVWIKGRGFISSNWLTDSVRGNTKILSSNLTNAEATVSDCITSLDTDGFTVGSNNNFNRDGESHVAWCWDAGSGSPVSNTDGSITSTVKASTDYGFSIVSYTGDAGTTSTVGHGLSQAPEFVIFKNRSLAKNWIVFSDYAGNPANGDLLFLNSTSALLTGNSSGNVSFNASTIGLDYGDTINGSGNAMIAYCFHSVSGYSKFGSYTGTGVQNHITTGFKPAFVMVKRTDTTSSWSMYDSVREVDNPFGARLYANISDAEINYGLDIISFDSTGFQIEGSTASLNASGGTYIYMAFADKREAAFWLDQSGNNNDFENNNLTESDISLDSPTNNFCTLNPLAGNTAIALKEGNLTASPSAQAGNKQANFGMSSGKWYWELYIQTYSSNQTHGITYNESYPTDYAYNYGYNADGTKYIGYTNSAYGSSFTAGDTLSFALDMDAGTLTAYKNNVSQGVLVSGLTETMFPLVRTDGTGTIVANFGQDSSFAGNKTAQGNTDDNGRGDFYYAPPTGYLALCTANLEVPDAMNPALDNSPQDYFNTVLYTGDGTSSKAVTGVGFAPDFIWIKARSAAYNNALFDKVRGINRYLNSNLTNAETYHTSYLDSFDADGFHPDIGGGINGSGVTFASWNWKANGSGVSNTDGSITSTVSANTDAGFSIVSYTGTGSAATVGHGLSQAPEFVITKNRDGANSWLVQGDNIGSPSAGDYLHLDLTQAKNTSAGVNTTFGASTMTLDVSSTYNGSTVDYIAYCFHSVEGFSKFGSYTGNGSTDGTFVYTGFTPAFWLVKADANNESWKIIDNKRHGGYNLNDAQLTPSSSNAESNDGNGVDFVSNGIKIRSAIGNWNSSGTTYIYMAFAENPFKYSTAR